MGRHRVAEKGQIRLRIDDTIVQAVTFRGAAWLEAVLLEALQAPAVGAKPAVAPGLPPMKPDPEKISKADALPTVSFGPVRRAPGSMLINKKRRS